ncbi:hypothetical protein FB107DRAFT_224827 [Schizophyllum commune]
MGKRKLNTTKPSAPCGNPGVWKGARKTFLEEHLPAFLDWGHSARKKFLLDVVEAYLALFPYHLDDSAPPPREGATEEEIAQADAEARNNAKAQASKQILSYFKNKWTKAVAIKKQPFRDFLRNGLKAVIARKPSRTEEAKVWMKHDEWRPKFVEEFDKRWPKANLDEKRKLTHRVEVAREMYELEDEEVKSRVRELAAQEYAERLKAYEMAVDAGGVVTKETAELCRANLAALLEPLLDEVLRMCGLTVASIVLARPPTSPGEPFVITSVHSGCTIKSEGALKLPEFDPDAYANIFLRHFMRFAILSTEESAELHRQEQSKQGLCPTVPPAMETLGNDALEADDPPPRRRRHSKSRRKSSHKRSKRTRDIDADELSGSETPSEDEDWADDGTKDDTRGELSSEGEDSDTPLIDVLRRQSRRAPRTEVNDIPIDDFGIPLRDARGRELPATLRAHLSRMSVVNRTKTLHDLDKGSDYEFERQCNIATNREKIRSQLDASGDLARDDPFYGEVTPKKVVRSGGTLASAPSTSAAGSPMAQTRTQRSTSPHTPPRRRSSRVLGALPTFRAAEGEEDAVTEVDEQPKDGEAPEQGCGAELDGQQGQEDAQGGEQDEEQQDEEQQDEQQQDEEQQDEQQDEQQQEEQQQDEQQQDDQQDDEHQDEQQQEEQQDERGDEEEDALAQMLALEGVSLTELEGDVARMREGVRAIGVGGVGQPIEVDEPHEKRSEVGGDAPDNPLQHNPTPTAQAGHGGAASRASTGAGTPSSSTIKRRRDEQDPPAYQNAFSADRTSWSSWFSNGVDNLVLDAIEEGSDSERLWIKLVGTWWKLEEAEGYKGSKMLPKSKYRPSDIPAWIKRHRGTTYAPEIPDDKPPRDFLEDWEVAMRNWWSDINPQWRSRLEDGTVTGRGTGDWSALDCRGANGHLSILKGLAWWFKLEGKPNGSRAWREHVEDVQWALECVLLQTR